MTPITRSLRELREPAMFTEDQLTLLRDLPKASGKCIHFGHDKVCVRVHSVTQKDDDAPYLIRYDKHPITKAGYFNTGEEVWGIDRARIFWDKSSKSGATLAPLEPCSMHEELVLRYLFVFFRTPTRINKHIEMLRDKSKSTLNVGTCNYTERCYSSVDNGGEDADAGQLFFASKTLFQNTQFCVDFNIMTRVVIKDYELDGICRDTAIQNYPDPTTGARAVTNDWMQITRCGCFFFRVPVSMRTANVRCRFLYPNVAKFKFETMEDLRKMRTPKVKEIIQAVAKDARALSRDRLGVGCNSGRTRSATVVLFVKLQLQIARLLAAAGSNDTAVVDQAKAELRVMHEDAATTQLVSMRGRMDRALERVGEQPTRSDLGAFTCDRDER